MSNPMETTPAAAVDLGDAVVELLAQTLAPLTKDEIAARLRERTKVSNERLRETLDQLTAAGRVFPAGPADKSKTPRFTNRDSLIGHEGRLLQTAQDMNQPFTAKNLQREMRKDVHARFDATQARLEAFLDSQIESGALSLDPAEGGNERRYAARFDLTERFQRHLQEAATPLTEKDLLKRLPKAARKAAATELERLAKEGKLFAVSLGSGGKKLAYSGSDPLAGHESTVLELIRQTEHPISVEQLSKMLRKTTQGPVGVSEERLRGFLESQVEGGTLFLDPPQPHGEKHYSAVQPEVVNQELANHQKAFVLLQYFTAKGRKLSQKEADNGKVFSGDVRSTLGFGGSWRKIDQLRKTLASEGYLQSVAGEQTKPRDSATYELTDSGFQMLLSLQQAPSLEFKLSGRAINGLLSAARSLTAPAPTTDQAANTPATKLGDAIYEEFQSLLRERHDFNGLVPIHEVREQVAAKLGADAARRDQFDVEVRRLAHARRIAVAPLAETSSATQDELRGSIPDGAQTLFYLQLPNEQPVAAAR